MHIPRQFELSDPEAIARVLRDYRFGLLITAGADGMPQASHIPFLYEGDGRGGRLLGHLAAANPQADELRRLAAADRPALAVFQGPHAYISPTWYGPGPHVPTWNYIAVHVSGVPRMFDDGDDVRALLARMTAAEEGERAEPWTADHLPARNLAALSRAVAAFELPATRMEAKAKLGQNKPAAAREGLQAGLAAEATPEAEALLAWTRALSPGTT